MKNWKTTVGGIIAGAALAVDPLVQAYNSGAFTGKSGAQLIAAIAVVLIGVYSKDHDVTGGTKPQS